MLLSLVNVTEQLQKFWGGIATENTQINLC